MTAEHDAERALRALFSDDLIVLPDRVLDAVLTELPMRRQRRRYRWARPIRNDLFGVAVAAALVVAVTAVVLVGRPGGVGVLPVPSTSPTPSTGPTPSASPTVAPGYGTEPPGFPTPAPVVAETALPDPSGAPLPADLVGREYNSYPLQTQGSQALVLTLRGGDDPHCVALYGGPRSTCFTILWRPAYPQHSTDPGARGSARIVDDNLVLGFDLVPFDQSCEGTSSTYAISGDRSTLTGIDWPACSFQGFTAH